jgi:ribonuclease R
MGERTHQRYRLGDRVQVKLVRVDLDTTRIDFVLPDSAGPSRMSDDEPRAPRGAKKGRYAHGR